MSSATLPAIMTSNEILSELEQSVKVLRRENSDLKAETDRMRNVVELAIQVTCCDRCDGSQHVDALRAATIMYQRLVAQEAKRRN